MKKLNKLFAILVAMAMVLSLSIIAAFADDPEPAPDRNITITKKLTLAQGLKAPENFTFSITPLSYNGETSGDAFAQMPTFTNQTIEMLDLTDTDKDGYIQFTKTVSTDVFAGKLPGLYEYKVDEVDGANTNITYDPNTYTVRILVDNNGKVTDIKAEDDTTHQKVSTTDPGTKETTKEDEQDYTASGVIFNNLYKKTFGENEVAATISKAVSGTYADSNKEFPFTLTIDASKAKTNYDNATYKVFKGNTEITTETPGTYTFNLKAGETVDIKGAPVGTTYTVVETLTGDASAQKYYAGAEVKENNETVAAKGITANETNKGGTPTVTDALIAETPVNSVAYTNNLADSDVTPTGILISNLPYIALALVAIGGLVAYVVVRRRQNDEA